MSKNKIDFANEIELKVKDIAGEFIKTAIIKAVATYVSSETTFTVDTVKDFSAGDEIYYNDGTAKGFTFILSVNITDKKIVLIGNLGSLKVGGVIKKSDAIRFIDESLLIYSKFKPCEKVHRIDGTGTDTYNLPSDWKQGLSKISSVEYPTGLQPAVYLKENRYKIYQNSANEFKIKFTSSLSTGETAYVNYTTIYSFSNNAANSPDTDFYAICNIAAYKYLLALAARYGQSTSPTISADSVNWQNKTDSYRRLAKEYLGQAASWLGLSIKNLETGETTPEPASSVQYDDVSIEARTIFLNE